MPKPRTHANTWESSPTAFAQPLPLAGETDLVNPMLRVHDVMKTDFRCAAPLDPLPLAAEIFAVSRCGFLPVVESSRPVGVLTDRDIALALHRFGGNLTHVRIKDVMTSPVRGIRPSAKLDDAIETMGAFGVRRLVVVDSHGRIEGVLSWTDLIPFIPERGVGWAVCQIVQRRAQLQREPHALEKTVPLTPPPVVAPPLIETEIEPCLLETLARPTLENN